MLDFSKTLKPQNSFYKKQLDSYLSWQLKNDLGPQKRDITSDLVLKTPQKKVTAQIIAKENGVIAGLAEISYFLKKEKFQVTLHKSDGDKIKNKDVVLKIKGSLNRLLVLERLILNLIQRMSGIATQTKKLVKLISPSITLCPTRKTLLGLLDKKAVSIGGGGTHRLGLYDAVLVKENHLKTNSLKQVISDLSANKSKLSFIEIEIEQPSQLLTFISYYQQITSKTPWIVMLDNFSITEIKQSIPLLRQHNLIIEISGNIAENNIGKYAKMDVDIISSGALTHSVTVLDLSLLIG